MSSDGADMAASESADATDIVLDIKNPSRNMSSFTLTVSVSSTVGFVKQRLSETYDGRPPARLQTLIYAGKVLKNETKLCEILPQPWQSSSPHSLHLVVKQVPPTPSNPTTLSTQSTPSGTDANENDPPRRTSSDVSATASVPESERPVAGPSTNQQDGRPSTSSFSPTLHPQICPYVLVNPVMAAAYQAAFAAAFAATAKMQQLQSGQGTTSNASPLPQPFSPFALYYTPYHAISTSSNSTASGNQQAQQPHPFFAAYPQMAPAPYPYGFVPYGVPPLQYPGFTQFPLQPQGFPAQLRQVEHNRQNARFAFPEGARYRRRVLSFRISLRTLLQFIVFAVVFYKQVSFTRFMVLVIGGLVLFLTANYPPLRRFASGMEQAATPENNTQAVQRRGLLWEIAVVVLGFITSLIPAWNYNPNDAAAFQAAQDMFAQDDDGDNRNAAQGDQGRRNDAQEPQQPGQPN